MMNYIMKGQEGSIDLQGTLSAGSAMAGHTMSPHHPITCQGELCLHENGAMSCAHARTEPWDIRTQHCLNQSVAMLLIELGARL